MASSKDHFESGHWLANSFASGAFRGTGVAPSTLSVTTPPWNVTQITATRTTPTTMQELAYLVGTMIYDFVNGWDGSLYTVAGSDDTTLDCDNDSPNQLIDVCYTLIDRNPGTSFATNDFTTLNRTIDYTMDCENTTGNEIADLLASLLAALDAVPHYDETFEITTYTDLGLRITRTEESLEVSI